MLLGSGTSGTCRRRKELAWNRVPLVTACTDATLPGPASTFATRPSLADMRLTLCPTLCWGSCAMSTACLKGRCNRCRSSGG